MSLYTLHASWSLTAATCVVLHCCSFHTHASSLLNLFRINTSEMNKNEEERKRRGEGREEEGRVGREEEGDLTMMHRFKRIFLCD